MISMYHRGSPITMARIPGLAQEDEVVESDGVQGAGPAETNGVIEGLTTSESTPEVVAVKRPSDASLKIAHAIRDRLGRRSSAPVRVAFIGARDTVLPEGAVPPMARILRGGRGGDVRLKLELSFLWFAASPPHDLAYPARAWALLIGLEDPEGKGARRVRQAISALSLADLVVMRSIPGRPNRIYLLDESGSGAGYSLPGGEYSKVRGSSEAWRHRYIQLPDTLWTNGWISALSGAALGMLLILFAELGQGDAAKTDLWFSPRVADETFGLSEDTRSKGLRELRAAGLISARRKAVSRDQLDFRRLRNTYRLTLERFSDVAEVPVDPDPTPPIAPSVATEMDMFAALERKHSKGTSPVSTPGRS